MDREKERRDKKEREKKETKNDRRKERKSKICCTFNMDVFVTTYLWQDINIFKRPNDSR